MDQTRLLQPLLTRLSAPLTLIDVGARFGAHTRWDVLGDAAHRICFEPDPEECARLNALGEAGATYVPVALAETEGVRDLYVTSEPACSSLHRPIPAMYEHYPTLDIIRPQRVLSVPCQRMDTIAEDRLLGEIAAIKLDTQGSELLILQGAERTLRTTSLVDVEVSFNPLYQDQALFCDLDRYMRDQGFVLWRLEHLAHYAPRIVPAAGYEFALSAEPGAPASLTAGNGQVFWSQAQYVRAELPRTGADTLTLQQALAPAIIAGAYGFWDLVEEIVRKAGDKDLAHEMTAAGL